MDMANPEPCKELKKGGYASGTHLWQGDCPFSSTFFSNYPNRFRASDLSGKSAVDPSGNSLASCGCSEKPVISQKVKGLKIQPNSRSNSARRHWTAELPDLIREGHAVVVGRRRHLNSRPAQKLETTIFMNESGCYYVGLP